MNKHTDTHRWERICLWVTRWQGVWVGGHSRVNEGRNFTRTQKSRESLTVVRRFNHLAQSPGPFYIHYLHVHISSVYGNHEDRKRQKRGREKRGQRERKRNHSTTSALKNVMLPMATPPRQKPGNLECWKGPDKREHPAVSSDAQMTWAVFNILHIMRHAAHTAQKNKPAKPSQLPWCVTSSKGLSILTLSRHIITQNITMNIVLREKMSNVFLGIHKNIIRTDCMFHYKEFIISPVSFYLESWNKKMHCNIIVSYYPNLDMHFGHNCAQYCLFMFSIKLYFLFVSSHGPLVFGSSRSFLH